MREIEVRIWDKTRGIMLYPENLTHNWYFRCDTFKLCQVKDKFGQLCINEVNETIIQQYTGLKDKNGKKIYEGDIITSDQRDIGGVIDTYEIEWNTDPCLGYGWGLWSVNGKGFRKLDGFSRDEVIGNIYENPELLGGEYK